MFIRNIRDCKRYTMGINEVAESLHLDQNLLDPPLRRIQLMIPVVIDPEDYSRCVCVIGVCVLSASKSAAMAVSAAQVKGLGWRSRSLSLSAIIAMH